MRSGWLLAVFAVVLAACGGGGAAVRPVGQEWLVAIRIEGNLTVADRDLIPRLSLARTVKTGRAADPYQLTLDTQRLRAEYLRLGYFEATVTGRLGRAATGAQTAVFVVSEGRRSIMNVELRGLPPEVPVARARALIARRDGEVFDYLAFDAAKLPLRELIEEAGYAHAHLYAAVFADKASGVATALYEVSPGVRCRFGAVTITGVSGDLADAIANRLAFADGDVYATSAVAKTQRALYELGRFSTVRVDAKRTPGEPVVPVEISVSLATRHEVKLGGGAGYDPLAWEARLRAGGSYVPLYHPLWTLFADARIAASVPHVDDLRPRFSDVEPKLRIAGTAQRIDLLRPRLTGEIGVGYDYLTVEAYTSTGPSLQLGLSSQLFVRWLSLRVGWALSYAAFSDISDVITGNSEAPALLASLGLDRAQRLGAYQAALVADLRDNPITTRRGVYFALRTATGTRAAGGALAYTQWTPDLRGYLPIGRRMVIAARVRGGAIFGDVPVTERYFSGGTQNHRGFSARRLAPSLTATDSESGERETVLIGGAGLLETGIELRATIGELRGLPLGATVFLDGGDVTNDPYDLDPLDLHWAAGAGLAVVPNGIKVRLDVAYRLNRKGPDEPEYGSNVRLHIGVGETF